MDNQLSYEQLVRLSKNPNYKMSVKQKALLAQYKAGKFKNNPDFQKHPTKLETPENGKPNTN